MLFAAVARLPAAMLLDAVTVLVDALLLSLYLSGCGCCSHGWAPKGPPPSKLVAERPPTVADSDRI